MAGRDAPVRPDTAYHALDPATLGRADAEITDVVDVSDVLDRREAAMAEHRSQASPYDGLSAELRRAFLTADHFARSPGRARTPVQPQAGAVPQALTGASGTSRSTQSARPRPSPPAAAAPGR